MDQFNIGDKVFILPGSEYEGEYDQKFGVIKRLTTSTTYPQKVGVEIEDAYNSKSSNGLFWFRIDHVKKAEVPTPLFSGSLFVPDVCSTLKLNVSFENLFLDIKRVIYNGPKTIILWGDGSKTIVSCGEKDSYDFYAGFCAAITKKVFGSTSAAKKALERVIKID